MTVLVTGKITDATGREDVASVTPTTITEETTLPGLVIAFSNGSLATAGSFKAMILR